MDEEITVRITLNSIKSYAGCKGLGVRVVSDLYGKMFLRGLLQSQRGYSRPLPRERQRCRRQSVDALRFALLGWLDVAARCCVLLFAERRRAAAATRRRRRVQERSRPDSPPLGGAPGPARHRQQRRRLSTVRGVHVRPQGRHPRAARQERDQMPECDRAQEVSVRPAGLQFAAERGVLETMQLLLEYGADSRLQDTTWAMSPLHLAARRKNFKAARIITMHVICMLD
ncbi:unnamed protein product [Trichogramma brassicae]|uniref:Uncharacterized protein n=1 Tax=Trichogramma brassicae TaxID=86971 RepID=A0A6H5I8Q1_9HYME|nr:unnamed protein product [Trichogramma brassicae]